MAAPKHPHLTGDAFTSAIREAARCRAQRSHVMDPIPSDGSRRPRFGSLITFRCLRCGTLRYDVVSRLTGEIMSRSYDAPAWYTAANEDKHDPAWWRAVWFDTLDPSLFLDAEDEVAARRRRKAAPQ